MHAKRHLEFFIKDVFVSFCLLLLLETVNVSITSYTFIKISMK